jgi:hypothetical protein
VAFCLDTRCLRLFVNLAGTWSFCSGVIWNGHFSSACCASVVSAPMRHSIDDHGSLIVFLVGFNKLDLMSLTGYSVG